MGFVEVQETIRKKVTVIKKTLIEPGVEAIIVIPKKGNKMQERENG